MLCPDCEDAFQCRQMKRIEQWYTTERSKISNAGGISSAWTKQKKQEVIDNTRKQIEALDFECNKRRCRLIRWQKMMLGDTYNPIYCSDRRETFADNLTHNERVLLTLYMKSHWGPGQKIPRVDPRPVSPPEQSQIKSMDRLMKSYRKRVISVYTAELKERLTEKREYYNQVDNSWCDDDLSINDFTDHDILSLIVKSCSNQFVKLLARYMLGLSEKPDKYNRRWNVAPPPNKSMVMFRKRHRV